MVAWQELSWLPTDAPDASWKIQIDKFRSDQSVVLEAYVDTYGWTPINGKKVALGKDAPRGGVIKTNASTGVGSPIQFTGILDRGVRGLRLMCTHGWAYGTIYATINYGTTSWHGEVSHPQDFYGHEFFSYLIDEELTLDELLRA